MIYLIQLYKMLNESDKEEFILVFSDFKETISESGYEDSDTFLFNDMLFIHFGLWIESKKQLDLICKCLLKHNDLKFLKLV